ncbi:Methyltransferase domain-containing protein [Ekhidna lutea]|uniref:Arsenite methyltransferase n=1 Tax=Ekhidna lutea TaxID=447679 RepID=A0A239J888_EKHLU|nr:class I SAM-dependent methyltransferase [Ekhidna lutea]SNT02077.1 Methyltransferase domain-containing protein [Ekhidna lutea]
MNRIIKFKESIFEKIDRLFIRIDKGHLRRTSSLKLIPAFQMRRGGKVSYAEWAYVIGIFHTLIDQNSSPKCQILDVGCGTGLLGIAAYNRVMSGGSYTGINVNEKDVEFCRSNFKNGEYDFIHLDTYNATYANNQQKQPIPWNLSNQSYDVITALSVWTHFNENDARYYLNEASRVLKGEGRAIISFFILDKYYDTFLKNKSAIPQHNALSFDWTFNADAYDSCNWKTTKWALSPEDAIAINEDGLNSLLQESGLEIDGNYPGTWKNYPGLYFQDILILKRKNA